MKTHKLAIFATINGIFLLCPIIFFFYGSNHQVEYIQDKILKGQSKEAEFYLQNAESFPLDQYYLFRAYIAREQDRMEDSNKFLRKAEELALTSSSYLLPEIYCNQMLNAYLTRDLSFLKELLKKVKINKNEGKAAWSLFKGLYAYENQNYDKALFFFEKTQIDNFFPLLQPIIKDKILKNRWDLLKVRCQIGLGFLDLADQKLRQLDSFDGQPSGFHKLLQGYILLKQIHTKSLEDREELLKKALEILQQVPFNQNDVDVQREVFMELCKVIFPYLKKASFHHLPPIISLAEQWGGNEIQQINIILLDFFDDFDERNLDILIPIQNIIGQDCLQKKCFEFLKTKYQAYFEDLLQMEDFNALDQHWQIANVVFFKESHFLSQLHLVISHKLTQLVSDGTKELKAIERCIDFWMKIEKSPQDRLSIILYLIEIAEKEWLINEEKQRSLGIMKMALSISNLQEKNQVKKILEKSLKKIYDVALQKDKRDSLLQNAMDELDIKLEIDDENLLTSILQDAEFYFNHEKFCEAKEKAFWGLLLDKKNTTAKRILGLSHYYLGEYEQAVPHLISIEKPSLDISKALTISYYLIGNHNEIKKLPNTSLKDPNVYFALGFGFLRLDQYEESLVWLNKILDHSEEKALGLCMAHYGLKNWQDALRYYQNLSDNYRQIPAIQKIAINSFTILGEFDQAEKIFNELLGNQSYLYSQEYSSWFKIFKQQKLDTCSVQSIAADFYYNVKGDKEKALNHYYQIDNPSLNELLNRAEFAYKVGSYLLAARDFENLLTKIDNVFNREWEQLSLKRLGAIYESLGWYVDAVRVFQKLSCFAQNDESWRRGYAKALKEIGRYSLAAEQYYLSEQSTPLPLEEFVAYIECIQNIPLYDLSKEIATNWLEQNPNEKPGKQLLLAKALLKGPNQAMSREILQKNEDDASLTNFDMITLAEIFLSLGEYTKASFLVEKMSPDIKNYHLLLKLGKNYEDLAKGKGKDNPKSLIENFESLELQQRYDKSLASLEQRLKSLQDAIGRYPNALTLQIAFYKDLIAYAIETMSEENRRTFATSCLKRAQNNLIVLSLQQSDIPEIFFLLGQTFYTLNQDLSAKYAFQKAISLNPSYTDAYKYLSLIYKERGDLEGERKILEKLEEYACSDDVEAWEKIAEFYERDRKIDKAIEMLQKAIQFNPLKLQNTIKLNKLSSKNKHILL